MPFKDREAYNTYMREYYRRKKLKELKMKGENKFLKLQINLASIKHEKRK